jgi:DNA-binding response OmpR family regulator
MRVLIVDDKPKITTLLRRGLRYEGHDMATSDGIKVCRRLGAEDNAPIIMLTASDDAADKVATSDVGPLQLRQERLTARRRRARAGHRETDRLVARRQDFCRRSWVAEPKPASIFR